MKDLQNLYYNDLQNPYYMTMMTSPVAVFSGEFLFTESAEVKKLPSMPFEPFPKQHAQEHNNYCQCLLCTCDM